MFDIEPFFNNKVAIKCDTEEERSEFMLTMQEEYPSYMRKWNGIARDLDYCYVIGFGDKTSLRCFPSVKAALERGCKIMPYRELVSLMWEPPDLSSLFNDVQ